MIPPQEEQFSIKTSSLRNELVLGKPRGRSSKTIKGLKTMSEKGDQSKQKSSSSSCDMTISGPTNVVRHHHATVDKEGNLDGLPGYMKMKLEVSQYSIIRHKSCELSSSI